MSQVQVSVIISASPEVVWADIENLASHVDWMADAESIEFLTDQTSGVGTTFDCSTRIGPFRTTDTMVVTEWDPHLALGVAHVGVVSGSGRFTLTPTADGNTEFTWDEQLRFPWWMGGPVGATLARPVLAWIWRRNLTRLAARFDG